MKVWTYAEARDKILKDLDLEEESFIQPDEMVGYFNEAIDEAEAEIHKLGVEDDYFLTSSPVSLVTNTEAYPMPSDMYATKIRGIVYKNGSEIYPVRRVRRRNKFVVMADTHISELYQYMLKNPDASTGYQMILLPPSRETSQTVMTMWYIRNANRIPLISEGGLSATESELIDIPEFINFILALVRVKIMDKDDHPSLPKAMGDLEHQRILMVGTLTQQVPDDDDEIEADFSHYEDMS